MISPELFTLRDLDLFGREKVQSCFFSPLSRHNLDFKKLQTWKVENQFEDFEHELKRKKGHPIPFKVLSW